MIRMPVEIIVGIGIGDVNYTCHKSDRSNTTPNMKLFVLATSASILLGAVPGVFSLEVSSRSSIWIFAFMYMASL